MTDDSNVQIEIGVNDNNTNKVPELSSSEGEKSRDEDTEESALRFLEVMVSIIM
jgi:hypothetical protein